MADAVGSLYTEIRGSGQDLVMVHGWGMHTGVWRDFARILATRFRVTCIDLPGHGRSGMIEDWTLPGVTGALMKTAPERAVWLGWSLGATIVLNLAASAPQRVDKAVLICGNAKFTGSDGWPGMEASLLEAFAQELERDRDGTLARFMALQTQGLGSPRALLKELRWRHAECSPSQGTALRAGLTILRHTDLRRTLGQLRCPGLLVCGGKDLLVPPSVGGAMRKLWKTADLQVIEGAAHTPFLSHVGECASGVLEFLNPSDRGDCAFD